MGAGGAASRALAWASLPLLGPPAGVLCEDKLYCAGKAGPGAGVPLALPSRSRGLVVLPHRGSGRGGGWGEAGSAPGSGDRARRSPQTHVQFENVSIATTGSEKRSPSFGLSFPIWKMEQ